MSVIIKDMDMPKTCSQCEIWSMCWDERPFWFERLEYCPLMEIADRKTEPQKIGYCNECKWYGDKQVCGRCRSRNLYAPKTEPSNSEKPNNCKAKPRKEQNFCSKCRYLYRDFKYGLSCYRLMDNEPCKYEERKDEPTISKMEQVEDEPQTCDDCIWTVCNYNKAFEDEPQTETEIAKAIVHKMIDDAIIAEDAYPDLRQRMHEAVERLDEYYPSDEERSE